MTSAPGIGFEVVRSRWPWRLAAGITALALVAIALSGLGLVAMVVLGVAVVAVAGTDAALRARSLLPRSLAWHADGRWVAHMAGGDELALSLRAHRVLGTLIWLRFRSEVRPRTVDLLLAPDNSDDDLRRRLRVRLARPGTMGPTRRSV